MIWRQYLNKPIPVHWTKKELPTYEIGHEPEFNSKIILSVQDGIQKLSVPSFVSPNILERLKGYFNGTK